MTQRRRPDRASRTALKKTCGTDPKCLSPHICCPVSCFLADRTATVFGDYRSIYRGYKKQTPVREISPYLYINNTHTHTSHIRSSAHICSSDLSLHFLCTASVTNETDRRYKRPDNRREFCCVLATWDYKAAVETHSM